MVASIHTVAFHGIDVLDIEVQVQVVSGLPAFVVVGLPDKAVAESRERVRAALTSIGLSLPPKRIIVNLSPADVVKEGSHFDLPIALGVLLTMEVLPSDAVDSYVALGELALDGSIRPVAGVLLAAMAAAGSDRGIVCPAASGGEAAFAGGLDVLAPRGLIHLINHFRGVQVLTPPEPRLSEETAPVADLRDIKGQETAKRALEIAAAGGHNMLMTGPPGAGKSMLASRLPGILPPLDPAETLEISMIHSVAGAIADGTLSRSRPFRDPHHTASSAAIIGGGQRARPGEVSLAHNGVLFLDELPEFQRPALEALRQPIETGKAVIARANSHVSYPARFQLVAAMNPCRCGWLDDPAQACSRAPRCAADYQARISAPLFDRIDIHIDVPSVDVADLALPPPAEGSAEIAARVGAARTVQRTRYADAGLRTNAEAEGEILEAAASPDADGKALLVRAAEGLKLTARGYHRVLRVARTIADLNGAGSVGRPHIAEALSYRRVASAAA